MKLGTKLPPGLINLPKTAFVFLCNAPNTSYILSERSFGSHAVDREEAAFKKLRGGSMSRTSTLCVGKRKEEEKFVKMLSQEKGDLLRGN